MRKYHAQKQPIEGFFGLTVPKGWETVLVEGMELSSRHGIGTGRKLRAHISTHTQEAENRESYWKWGARL